MNISKKILNKETFLYLIFGILTTIVNIVSFFLFNKLFDYKLSNIIAFILAIVFAYITNKIYVFESKKEEKSKRKIKTSYRIKIKIRNNKRIYFFYRLKIIYFYNRYAFNDSIYRSFIYRCSNFKNNS